MKKNSKKVFFKKPTAKKVSTNKNKKRHQLIGALAILSGFLCLSALIIVVVLYFSGRTAVSDNTVLGSKDIARYDEGGNFGGNTGNSSTTTSTTTNAVTGTGSSGATSPSYGGLPKDLNTYIQQIGGNLEKDGSKSVNSLKAKKYNNGVKLTWNRPLYYFLPNLDGKYCIQVIQYDVNANSSGGTVYFHGSPTDISKTNSSLTSSFIGSRLTNNDVKTSYFSVVIGYKTVIPYSFKYNSGCNSYDYNKHATRFIPYNW